MPLGVAGAAIKPLSALPAPDAAAIAHSARVRAHIAKAIADAGGSIGFDHFMQLALYAPGLGYYQAGQARFGAGGDFVTAPESSPLFGRSLARQVAAILTALPAPAAVLEIGAGTGALAAALVPELIRLGARPSEYLILDVSGDLRAAQRERLRRCGATDAMPIRWLDRLPQASWRGVVIANEVLDALPVRRFRKDADGRSQELAVGMRAGEFAWVDRAPDQELSQAIARIETRRGTPLPRGYVSEYCPWLTPWCAGLAEKLDAGAVLLVDFGYRGNEYYHDERDTGALICHYRHHAHDNPFAWIGLQDLSCSVDFSALSAAATAAGLDVAGYCSQAHFLLGCGIERLLADTAPLETREYLAAAGAAKRLMLPGEMGERFKVLGLARNLDAAVWPGFRCVNHRDRL